MTAISKNVYFNVLDDIVNNYNNTVHRTIKIKPIDVRPNSCAECNEDLNKKNPKFKVGDHVRISKYKNIFAEGYTPNWSEEVFVVSKIKMKPIDVTSDSYAEYNEDSNKKDLKFKVGEHVRTSKYRNIFAKGYTPNWSEGFVVSKIKNTVPWTYAISDLNDEPITGGFYKKELQKTNQKKFKIEKEIKRKGDKLYVKSKGYAIHLVAGLIKKTLYKNDSILS